MLVFTAAAALCAGVRFSAMHGSSTGIAMRHNVRDDEHEYERKERRPCKNFCDDLSGHGP
jgi:hypothetical protein